MANVAEFNIKFSDLKLLNEELNTTEKKVKLVAKEAKRDFRSLELAIDPVARATKMFKDQVLVAQKAVATSAITQEQYARTFKMIQTNAKASGLTINQFGQIASVNTRKMKRFGAVGMQQVGYQVQDFAVQVQGGTKVMVALGQQGSQLLGIFGPAGAIAGMILAIGTGLAGAFMAAKNATDTAIKPMVAYKEAMDVLKDSTKDLKLELYMLQSGITNLGEAQANQAIKALRRAKANAAAERRDKFAQYPQSDGKGGVYTPEGDGGDIKTGFMGLVGPTYDEAIANLIKMRDENAELDRAVTGLKTKAKARKDEIALNLKNAAILSDLREDQRVSLENVMNIGLAEGRNLLIAKQQNAMRALGLKIQRAGGSVVESQLTGAMANLKVEQKYLLKVYDVIQAKKEELQANKDLKKAEQKRLQAIKEAARLNKIINADYLSIIKRIDSSMESAFMSMVDGTKSVSSAFKSMAAEIIKELYRIYVVKKVTGMIMGAIDSSFDPFAGTSYDGGGYTGNGARSGGLDGKGGFMAMLHPRETVVDHTKGGSGGGVSVVQNINVTTGVQQTVRAEIRQLMPQIAASAKGAVLDAKRRGGSYGSSFA